MLAHERSGVELVVEKHNDGTMRPHLCVSDHAYFELIDELIVKVMYDPDQAPNQLVGILWGADIPTRAFHLTTGIPVATLTAESYRPEFDDDHRNMRCSEGIQFARDLSKKHPGFGNDVLLIDDLTDTGRTLHDSRAWLMASPTYGCSFIKRIRTACLWHKQSSKFMPDFYVDEVVPVEPKGMTQPMLPWIDQPIEIGYAKYGIAGVRERVEKRGVR